MLPMESHHMLLQVCCDMAPLPLTYPYPSFDRGPIGHFQKELKPGARMDTHSIKGSLGALAHLLSVSLFLPQVSTPFEIGL